MITARRTSWPDFSPRNSTTAHVPAINDPQLLYNSSNPKTNTNSETSMKDRNSTDSFTAWSLNSFMAIIPSSPSPNCSSFSPLTHSSCSPGSDFFYSQVSPSVFSSPLNKGLRWSDVDKMSESSSEETEEKRNNSNDLHTLYLQNKDFDGEEILKEEINPANTQCMSYSTEYRSFDGYQPLGVLPLQLPALVADEEGEEEEEEEETEEKRDGGVSGNSSKESELTENSSLNAHQTLIARPKPYHAFLEEIKKRELEDEVDAWEESKHSKLMNKLQRKEDVITSWELKKTRIATLRMKKTECKLERKRAKAFKRMQKKIGNVQMKAEEKKAKERHLTGRRICKVSKFAQKIKSARSRIWLRFFCFL